MDGLTTNDIELIKVIQENGTDFDFKRIFGSDNFKNEIFDKYNKKDPEIVRQENGVVLPTVHDDVQKKENFKLMQCKKRFLDLMTNLIAKEICFFDTHQDYIGKFQFVVTKVYQDNIANYLELKQKSGARLNDTDILFLYKGGTTMKIVYEKYKAQLKESGLSDLFDTVAKVFERSDSDYTILINPKINERDNGISFEQIYYEINVLSYNCLDLLRYLFNKFQNVFIPLNRVTDDILKKKVEEMNTTLAEIKEKSPECVNVHNIKEFLGISFLGRNVFIKDINGNIRTNDIDLTFDSSKNPESQKYIEFREKKYVDTKKYDFLMSLTDDKDQYYREMKEKGKNDIYLSINESHEYVKSKILTFFTLHRLKINSIAYYLANDNKIGFFDCPSELIDVTVLKKQSFGLELFYEHVDKEFMTYTYNSPNLVFDFKSYSIYGHITDLIFVLFAESSRPWEDVKYLKRIKRLMFFILLELIINVKDKNKLKNMIQLIKKISEQNMNVDLVKQMINSISEGLASKTFFEKLEELMIVANKEGYGEDKQKYDDLFMEMNNIVSLVPLNNLEIGDVKEEGNVTMLGGYFGKYLKYKHKNRITHF